jgi:hypothetical protein
MLPAAQEIVGVFREDAGTAVRLQEFLRQPPSVEAGLGRSEVAPRSFFVTPIRSK